MRFIPEQMTYDTAEVNLSNALHTGDVVSQSALTEKEVFGVLDNKHLDMYVENGTFYYNIGNLVKTFKNVTAADRKDLAAYIHYTEEVIDTHESLNNYAVGFSADNYSEDETEGRYAYPRLIKLIQGDMYTVSKFTYDTGVTEDNMKYGTVQDDGSLLVLSALPMAYTGPLFTVKPTTAPNGIDPAIQIKVEKAIAVIA